MPTPDSSQVAASCPLCATALSPEDAALDVCPACGRTPCPHCGEPLTERQTRPRFCPHCDHAACPGCGASRARGAIKCPHCGNVRLEFMSD